MTEEQKKWRELSSLYKEREAHMEAIAGIEKRISELRSELPPLLEGNEKPFYTTQTGVFHKASEHMPKHLMGEHLEPSPRCVVFIKGKFDPFFGVTVSCYGKSNWLVNGQFYRNEEIECFLILPTWSGDSPYS